MKKADPKFVLKELKKLYPNPHHYLDYDGNFQLMVITILSAQCRDEVVNEVGKKLFAKHKSVKDFAKLKQEQLEQEIKSIPFFRNKSKAIIAGSKQIIEEYNGAVPDNMQELTKLPGIGRKTANVILGHGFNKLEGVTVDTHVIRIANKLGWTNTKNAEKIEQDLIKLIPKSEWKWLQFYMKEHGRAICHAPIPKCNSCTLNNICPSSNLK